LHSHAVGSAAYRSGDELRDENGEIVHDYTKKSGVVHSEIMLPQNAPPEFADRETLWNAVEIAKRRKDAQLAREINVALPTEFDLEEQKALLREYIKENFVDKGMIADFAIHHARAENPHAHIMLTTRTVTPDGFGNKNHDWNSRQILVDWREDWADKTNRILEEKGLEERIDHRTLKAQGIDREPTIHLGRRLQPLNDKAYAPSEAIITAKLNAEMRSTPPIRHTPP
jgi:ATP-dependent exoDNAse (exonuclease V) alpha subunit